MNERQLPDPFETPAAPASPTRLPAWLRGPWGVAALAAAAYTIGFIVMTALRWGGLGNAGLIADTLYLLINLFPVVVAGRVALERRLASGLRQAWALFTLAFLCQFIGNAIWLYQEVMLQEVFPSSADFFYLIFIPLLLLGLLLQPGSPMTRGERVRFWLDLGIVAIGATTAIWQFLVMPTLAGYPNQPLNQWLAASYPIGDLVILLGALLVIFRRPAPDTQVALGFFSLGLLGFLISDIWFGYQSLIGTYVSGSWVDVGWWIGLTLFGFAGARQLIPGEVSWVERGLLWGEARLSSLLPLAAVAGMYALVILAAAGTAMVSDLNWLLAGAVLVTVLVLIRQLNVANTRSSQAEPAVPVPASDPAQAENTRLRNATWTALLFAVAFLAGGMSLVVRVLAGTAPANWWVTVAADVAAAVGALVSLLFIRRRRLVVGALLTLAAGLAVILVTASQTAGLGFLLAIVTIVVVSAVAGLTLPAAWANQAIVAGVLTAVGALLIDQFGPADRPADPTPLYTLSVAGALLVIYVIFLARQFRTFSLRAKLAAAFVATTVITVGAVAAVAGWVVQQEVSRQVGLNLQSIAQSQGVTAGTLLEKQVDDLRTLSLNPLLRDSAAAANQAYAQPPTALAALNAPWRQAADDDPALQTVLTNPAAQALNHYVQQGPDYLEVLITDQYGAVVAATRRPADYFYGDQAWWQTAYQQGAVALALGQPAAAAADSLPGLDMAVPIRSADGRQVVGVLRAVYDLNHLLELLSVAQVSETGHTDILLPAGGLLSREHAAAVFDVAVRDQIAAIPLGGYGDLTLEGEPHLVSRAAIRPLNPAANAYVDALGWTIVADLAAAEAYQPVQVIVRLLVLVGIGALLVAGVLALTVAQTLAGPIVRLTDVAARVAAGDLTARATVEASDETGLLANTFNSMTVQLRETLTGLERRVDERTRDLGLAAEIGQRLAAVRDLEILLAEAVESIRQRFELYYTQIYLLDPAGRGLQMQAGTGPVGAQLKQRGFRLAVNANSINGTAVLERRPVIVADTTRSATFRPNALLPLTRSEMAVPLLVGDRVVGVLDMQSEQPHALSADSLPAFTALAGQLAIAIENARLFAQAEQVRAEIETQARRLTRAGWEEYLNAVDRPETVSRTFGEAEPTAAPHVAAAPIAITGQPVGELRLEGAAEWSEADRALLATVAERVAQQVENLRLLRQAEQYQNEAESTLRRLTREGWRDYQEATGLPATFTYVEGQVTPAPAPAGPAQPGQPLVVQGEVIGALEVESETPLSAESEALLAKVAAQLSAHIENLRLSDATQLALAETETLFQITARLNAAASTADVVGVLAGLDAAESGGLFLVEMDAAGRPTDLLYSAGWPQPNPGLGPLGSRLPLATFPEAAVWQANPQEPSLVGDLEQDERVQAATRALYQSLGVRAAAFLPLSLAGRWIGLVTLSWTTPRAFTDRDVQLYRAAAAQATVIVNNRVLFEQTRRRADREAVINTINQRIQSAVTVEAALATAAQEIGRLLKVQRAVVRLGDSEPDKPNGHDHA